MVNPREAWKFLRRPPVGSAARAADAAGGLRPIASAGAGAWRLFPPPHALAARRARVGRRGRGAGAYIGVTSTPMKYHCGAPPERVAKVGFMDAFAGVMKKTTMSCVPIGLALTFVVTPSPVMIV